MKNPRAVVNELLAQLGYRISKIHPERPAEQQVANSRFQKWLELGEPSYDDDYIVTWKQSIDFMQDPKFLHAYEMCMDSDRARGNPMFSGLNITWRVAMSCWIGRHAAHLPGDFVECGVNTGGRSLAVCDYLDFNTIDKSFYLFDTYNGIPIDMASASEHGRAVMENELYYDECFELVRRNFAPYPRAVLVRGAIPETLNDVRIDEVAYLHIDMNIAAPERAAIEHFWPKMTRGGIVYLDDYGWTPYRAQKDTMDEFAAAQGVEIMMLPTGQGLLIKP